MADTGIPKYDDTDPVKQEASVPQYEDTHPVGDQPTAHGPQPMAPIDEKDVGSGEALLRGGVQGATLGFGDEALGGIKALGSKVTGDQQSLADLYRMYRDIERAKDKAAESAHPWLYTAGNIGGGVVGGLATAAVAPEALAARLGTAGGATALGAATGLGTSDSDLTRGTAKDIKDATIDTAAGGLTGYLTHNLFSKIKSAVNPTAREMGQKEIPILGEKAEEAIKNKERTLAETIITDIKAEHGKLDNAYNAILEAHKDKTIDISSFVQELEQKAANLDTSLPEQARDKKAILDLVQKVAYGPETEKEFPIMKQGKTFDYQPSAKESLEQKLRLDKMKADAVNAPFESNITEQIDPATGKKYLIPISRTMNIDAEGHGIPSVTPGTPVLDTEAIPAHSTVEPGVETRTVREGGSMTPELEKAKNLRTNLGTLAYEKNMSNVGSDFAKEARYNLSDTLKKQVPDIANVDARYSPLQRTMDKLGIQGNEEDLQRVLSKISSSNPGKEITVEQAINQLQQANPELASKVQQGLDTVSKQSNVVQNAQDFLSIPHTGNKIRLGQGILNNIKGARDLGSYGLGSLENKVAKIPLGTLTLKAASQIPRKTLQSPFAMETVHDYTGTSDNSQPTETARKLYNATDDSLKLVAEKMKTEPGAQHYAESLMRALNNKDEGEKNRAIFLILQNPNTRKLVSPED